MSSKSKAIKFVLATWLLLLAAGNSLAGSAAMRAYQDAVKSYDAGRHDAALLQLKTALKHDPKQLAAKVLLGKTLLTLGHPQSAAKVLAEASELGAKPAQIMLPLAQARNQLGRFQHNIATIRPEDMAPDLASDLWVELGVSRLALNDSAGAQVAFDEALEIKAGNIGALLGLVTLHLARQDIQAAEELCDQILNIAPDNADAWFIKGTLLESNYKLTAAESHFDRALALNPSHLKAHLAKAIVILNLGRAQEAIPLFEKILQDQPWSLESAYLLSQALGVDGQLPAAQKALQRAADMVAKVSPDELAGNPRLLLISSLVTYDTEDIDASLRFLSSYLRHKPKDVQARKQMAKLMAMMGRSREAINELRRLLLSRPRDPQLHIMLGDIYVQTGDYTKAEWHYATALDIGTPNAKLIAKVGISQTGRGRSDLAIDTMQRLVDLAPGKSAGASIFLGILYLHEGNLDAAHSIADHIVAQMPEHLLAINLQAVVAVARGNYQVGRNLFERALDSDSEFHPARINLIKLDVVQERYQRARKTLDSLLESEPENISALRTLAELQMVVAEHEAAAQSLERIRSLDPGSVRDILLLSQVYDRIGQPQKALDTVLELEKFAPEAIAVKLRLAEIKLQNSERDIALSYLDSAAQLASGHPGRRLRVARMQTRIGAYDAAKQGIRDALSEDPDAPEAGLLLGKIHALQGDLAKADDTISAVTKAHPNHARAHAVLGDIRLERGHIQDALSLYRQASKLENNAANALRLHRARIRAGNGRKAIRSLAAWHRDHPGNEDIMSVLADHYVQAGQRAKGLALYRALIDSDPNNIAAHNNLALALLPLDTERALASALTAYQLAPTSAAVLDTLGWIQVRNGDLEAGLPRLREALARAEHVAEIRYHLAVALEGQGAKHEARQQLHQALQQKNPFTGRADAERRLRRLDESIK